MKNTKVLELLNSGKIEELRKVLQDEIYAENLKKNHGSAKDRYSAMKRYFRFCNNVNKVCFYPCENVTVHGKTYNSFCDGYSFALTTESLGEMETYNNAVYGGTYINMESLVTLDMANSVDKFDFNTTLSEAKSKGYKFSKKECNETSYLFKYKDAYFRLYLLDKVFSILNDGESAEVYYINRKAPLFIKTSIGIGCILPINASADIEEKKTVIHTEK